MSGIPNTSNRKAGNISFNFLLMCKLCILTDAMVFQDVYLGRTNKMQPPTSSHSSQPLLMAVLPPGQPFFRFHMREHAGLIFLCGLFHFMWYPPVPLISCKERRFILLCG